MKKIKNVLGWIKEKITGRKDTASETLGEGEKELEEEVSENGKFSIEEAGNAICEVASSAGGTTEKFAEGYMLAMKSENGMTVVSKKEDKKRTELSNNQRKYRGIPMLRWQQIVRVRKGEW